MQSIRRTLATAGVCAVALAGVLVPLPAAAAPPAGPLPAVSPTPQWIDRAGGDINVPGRVEIVVDDGTDAAALAELRETLGEHGVDRIDERVKATGTAPLTITLGAASRADIAAALGETDVPDHAEGYALRADASKGPLGTIALGGVDGAGQYYAVKTLDQLFVPKDDGGYRIAGASVSDYPSMPLRGTIEGFYGNPWTHEERVDQLEFYGDVKANTYVYAPKDDPYHRDRWREPYPADKLAELGDLVTTATANHVRFTFALSPGNTVCYSSDADYQALTSKLQQMYDLGVRAFNIPLDDIDYGRWHCDGDRTAFGAPSGRTAGIAQATFLDRVQREFIETHEGAYPLQMVPTEYYNTTDSGYKSALRGMDEDVIVMWTGEGVVPQSVTVAQAQKAATVFGGPTFLWDNYPVNDYGNTSGRLLLAPYDKREAGLGEYLSGIVSNPMNQAAASKIAIFGVADFTWNDEAYDAGANWSQALRYVANEDAATTAALRVFADLNHLAPSFGAPWQPQAPELSAAIAGFWEQWDAGDKTEAVADLREYAEAIAAAPAAIRSGPTDPAFLADASPWLDATTLWGQATVQLLDAVQARIDGDEATSAELAATAKSTAAQAAATVVDPADNSWGKAKVRIADGVLDLFHGRIGFTLAMWEAGDVVNVAPQGTATASSVEVPQFGTKNVNDDNLSTRWASGYSDDSWVQVKLAEPTVVRGITLNWESACANEYALQTSNDGVTWTTIRTVDDSTCGLDLFTFDAGDPVQYVRMQGIDRKTTWGYSIWELGVYAAG
ncbi:beta-N-acetylglucosaminidase domain-containing protein [Agromyces sp. SYSU K20354]|uniref:beta-N-acetylglucosaminidase domain-containing protein n=1 Tax=Agromyces cavernae TaxID=2898659 RepID=UPI001E40CE68|nr:beta-N-acetylglucosaminidase domain-containing protein [Agromyces cavernae]MCD2443080.1 beta-N-acetylglucosaminidase domain-containing protein [Agromyces cavernae]